MFFKTCYHCCISDVSISRLNSHHHWALTLLCLLLYRPCECVGFTSFLICPLNREVCSLSTIAKVCCFLAIWACLILIHSEIICIIALSSHLKLIWCLVRLEMLIKSVIYLETILIILLIIRPWYSCIFRLKLILYWVFDRSISISFDKTTEITVLIANVVDPIL